MGRLTGGRPFNFFVCLTLPTHIPTLIPLFLDSTCTRSPNTGPLFSVLTIFSPWHLVVRLCWSLEAIRRSSKKRTFRRSWKRYRIANLQLSQILNTLFLLPTKASSSPRWLIFWTTNLGLGLGLSEMQILDEIISEKNALFFQRNKIPFCSNQSPIHRHLISAIPQPFEDKSASMPLQSADLNATQVALNGNVIWNLLWGSSPATLSLCVHPSA